MFIFPGKSSTLIITVVFMTLASMLGISCTNESLELGDDYAILSPNSGHAYILHRKSNSFKQEYFDRLIPCNVISYDFNDDYIVALQMPSTECVGNLAVRSDVSTEPGSGNNYWIVDKEALKTYGPYTEEEYITKRQELDVPDDLKLDPKD
ncbi:MAG: DUF3997 domain-containing protein [Thermoleophilia bacterium]